MLRVRSHPWWLRNAAVIALTSTGFVLRHYQLHAWSALVDSFALALLIEPLLARATRWARRRNRA